MLEMAYLGNALIFMLITAWQLDVFSPDDSSDDEDELDPYYDESAYSGTATGTSGSDILDAATEGPNIAYFGRGGDDLIEGSDFNDFADGGTGADTLIMRPGDDVAGGGGGNDSIFGGLGNDTLLGEDGDDLIEGSRGNDLMLGGDGADSLAAGGDDDTVLGGAGDDIVSGDLITDLSLMGRGTDVLDGGSGDDALLMGDTDTATGGSGADAFTVHDVDTAWDGPATITDFDPAEDTLEIYRDDSLDPAGTGYDLQVLRDEDAGLTTVTLNGEEMVRLEGAPELDPAAISLVLASEA